MAAPTAAADCSESVSTPPFDPANASLGTHHHRRLRFLQFPTAGGRELLLKIRVLYCRRFSSPKWNDFKGVCVDSDEKVRLNNLIWREWHRQFVAGQRTTHCEFSCPVDDPVHYQPQAVVLEGKYWKKKYDAVAEQYRQWRVFWAVRRSRAAATDELAATDCILDQLAQQDDLQQAASAAPSQSEPPSCNGASCQPHAIFDLDALLEAWTPDSAFYSDLTRQAEEPDAVVAQCVHEDTPDLDFAEELFDGCEEQDAMDVQASETAFHHDADRCCPPCLPSAAPRPIGAPPLASHDGRAPPLSRNRRTKVANGVDILRDVLSRGAGAGLKGASLPIAKVMERAAACCRQMRQETAHLNAEAALTRWNIDQLRRDVASAQVAMSPSDTLVSPSASWSRSRETFDAWVCARSSENCKFALFAALIGPLFDSFMASVSVTSAEELSQSLLDWQREQLTLNTLRQSVLSALTALSQSTSMLPSADKLDEELPSERVRACSYRSTDALCWQRRLS